MSRARRRRLRASPVPSSAVIAAGAESAARGDDDDDTRGAAAAAPRAAVVFLHLQKTGGWSLLRLAKDAGLACPDAARACKPPTDVEEHLASPNASAADVSRAIDALLREEPRFRFVHVERSLRVMPSVAFAVSGPAPGKAPGEDTLRSLPPPWPGGGGGGGAHAWVTILREPMARCVWRLAAGEAVRATQPVTALALAESENARAPLRVDGAHTR